MLSTEFGIASQTISPVYMILNVCRTFAYLQTGKILSKAEGGEWALGNIPPSHRAVVEAALASYREDGDDHALETTDLEAFKRWGGEVIRLP